MSSVERLETPSKPRMQPRYNRTNGREGLIKLLSRGYSTKGRNGSAVAFLSRIGALDGVTDNYW